MSYRHDRRRKLIRRWQREGWREVGYITEGGGRIFAAEPGTPVSVGALDYAAHMADKANR